MWRMVMRYTTGGIVITKKPLVGWCIQNEHNWLRLDGLDLQSLLAIQGLISSSDYSEELQDYVSDLVYDLDFKASKNL